MDDEYAMLERQILGESAPLIEPKTISQPQVRREPLQEEQEEQENDENSMHVEQLLS